MPRIVVPSRATARKALASWLKGSVQSVQTVYHYQNDDIKGESPVIRIMGSGSFRPRITMKGSRSIFALTIQLLVIFKDQDPDTKEITWTPEQAEDRLDLVEAEVARVLYYSDIPSGCPILSIEQSATSAIRKDVISGTTYLNELMPVQVELNNEIYQD